MDASDPLVGSTLGGCYVIESRIAAGGYGVVYRARWMQPGRTDMPVAIKVVQWKHTNDAAIGARFRREAEALSSLASRHTVHTFHRGEDRATGTQFLVMELLEGESLFARFAKGPMPWRAVLQIVRQVCESLAEAHAAGIVHRDLKPSNIFLVHKPTADFVKVLDFGIAKVADRGPKGAPLTEIGHAIGTPEYMSAEQMLGRGLDGRSDIYTLGIVMYEMIAGVRPYPEKDLQGLITAMTTRRPMPLSARARWPIPAGLDAVVDRCLGRDAKDRYDNVKQLAHAIDQILDLRNDKTTLRQWHTFGDDDERTWIPTVPSKRKPASGGGLALVEARTKEPHREAVIRTPLVETERMKWRPLGTGVQFDKREVPPPPVQLARGSFPVINRPRPWLRIGAKILAAIIALALFGLAIGTIVATFTA